MSGYTPHTPSDVAAMLATIGVESLDALFAHVPASLRERASIPLPPGLSEPDLRRRLESLAARNTGAAAALFIGAGAYAHVVPALVDQVLLRAEFATAYTPYQPEVSQGTLQATFEFQSFVTLLFGLEVANASMYDGASAAAEAVLMARRVLPGRRTVWLSRALHPHYRATIATYVHGLGDLQLREVPFTTDGQMDVSVLRDRLDADALCVVVGQPNVFGVVEDVARIAGLAQEVGALIITATSEPVALAMIRPPGSCGADIAVAEGQSFGLPLSYGGPAIGLFATHERYLRSMPGRIVGETVDAQGRRGYVLTLATREQHIRRERATSNICTNQGLCALAVTAYLSLLGRHGLRRLAEINYATAHEVADRLAVAGVSRVFNGPFFNEFVVHVPGAANRWEALADDGIVAGYPLGRWYPELEDALVLCATERNTPEEIARLVDALAAGGSRARASGG